MKKTKTKGSKKRFIKNSLVHLLLAFLGFIWVLPIVFVVLTSLRKESGSYKSYVLPRGYTLDNFKNLFSQHGSLVFTQWLVNTLIVSVVTCLLSAFIVLCVAYTMSRLKFKMRKHFMSVAFILTMFPSFMSMIAVYYILKGFGLLEQGPLKLAALTLVYAAGSAFGFYVAKGYFDTIPRTIDEAAYIDGATKWDVFLKISIPLSKPIIVNTLITSFMGPWIDYIFARVILGNDRRYYTIAIGLWTMLEKEFVEYYYTTFFAGCVIISIPIAILFLLTQRFYQEGVSGSVKG